MSAYEPADVDILTRGPVHEAFAEPISLDPEPGPLAPFAPPQPIQEVPPDYQPDGFNVDWIPGYWAWDDDLHQYLWVSGIWRDLPPGREWIAGYWIQADSGFRWIPGYWVDRDYNETVYLPEPPVSMEAGASYSAAPSPDHIWVSGTWVWYQETYAWRPGYWMLGQPDWVWVPAHYVWTPRGYIFVDGYWDYDLQRRGVLFAPVRFERQVTYTGPRYSYTPRTVIDLTVLTDHLFLRPTHYHYYFGDYYDDHYVSRGYRPWFEAHRSHRVYDPIYVHRRWSHRHDHDWDDRLRRDHDHRRRDHDARPARSWADQRRFDHDRDSDRRGDRDRDWDRDRDRGRDQDGDRDRDRDRPTTSRLGIAKSLAEMVQRTQDPVRFNRVDDAQRRRLSQRGDEVQRTKSQRRQVEGTPDGRADSRYQTRIRPERVPAVSSPITSKSKVLIRKDRKPPQRPTEPKVDRRVKATKRPATIKRSGQREGRPEPDKDD